MPLRFLSRRADGGEQGDATDLWRALPAGDDSPVWPRWTFAASVESVDVVDEAEHFTAAALCQVDPTESVV